MDDLSGITAGVVGQSSMGASNTLSVNPPFSPEGSESEATQGIETHSVPEPDLGETWHPANRVDGGDALAGYGFSYVTGVGHAGE